MEPTKKLFKVLKATVVGDLSYDEGQTYELTDEQAAAFAEGEIEVVATPDSVPPASETPGAEAPGAPAAPEAPATPGAPTPAKPWVGNHTVGRE